MTGDGDTANMERLFAVIRSRGPAWRDSRAMEQQDDWSEHAAFMDALEHDGFVVLGGPLGGTSDVLLVVRAKSAEQVLDRLSADPWSRQELLCVSRVMPWTLRLGSLP